MYHGVCIRTYYSFVLVVLPDNGSSITAMMTPSFAVWMWTICDDFKLAYLFNEMMLKKIQHTGKVLYKIILIIDVIGAIPFLASHLFGPSQIVRPTLGCLPWDHLYP
jgi:hypothetical protein